MQAKEMQMFAITNILTLMTVNDRFQAIIDSRYNGNKAAFAKAIGISPTVVENVVGARRGKPSFEVLSKICANANISEAWLLSGEGSMLKTNSTLDKNSLQRSLNTTHKDTNKENAQEFSLETRPRIPLEAAAGSLSIALGSATKNDCEQIPVIPTFPKYDFTIVARGNSMEPQYLSGDELACLFVRDSTFIQWGRAHVLDTTQGIVVKRIFDNGDAITCKSNNPAFPDFDIPKTEILRMALVVGYIRIE